MFTSVALAFMLTNIWIMKSEFSKKLVKEEVRRIQFEAPVKLPMREAQEKAIARLREEKAIINKAKEMGFTVSQDEVEWLFNEFRRLFPTDAEFYKFLKKQHLDEDEVRDDIARDILMFKVLDSVAKTIKISDDDTVKRPYEVRYREIFIYSNPYEPKGRRISKIAKAWWIWLRLKLGADFCKMAEKYSSRSNRERCGDAGFTSYMPTSAVRMHAWRLKPGQLSKPIVTTWGITILRVEEVRGGEPVRFGDLSWRLKRLVFMDKVLEKLDQMLSE